MAKIKIRFGTSEIEVDSRDFYLDNQTVGNVIEDLSKHMSGNPETPAREAPAPEAGRGSLESLRDAEAFEPEFDEPRHIEAGEIRPRLRALESDRFFDSPRTVAETVKQLRESGWDASSLDVSVALARMASSKEISKNSDEDRTYYFAREGPTPAASYPHFPHAVSVSPPR